MKKEMSKDEMFEPLGKYTSQKIWDNMMFMGIVNNIFLYKHDETKRYINIDRQGRFYVYTGYEKEPYIEITKDEAIENLNLSSYKWE